MVEHRPRWHARGAVVVGVDGSDVSMRAAAFAAGTARRQGARLVAVYVREGSGAWSPGVDMGGHLAAMAVEAQDGIEAEVRRELLDPRFADGLAVELVVRRGDPLREIAAVAGEAGADAVVVGASTTLAHRVVGSIAVRLVRLGRWPVTVVP